jgi:alpha-L-rhamnosidase
MKKYMSLFIATILSFTSSAQLKVQNLLTENLTDPIGLGVMQPRFSWQLVSDKKNTMQNGI